MLRAFIKKDLLHLLRDKKEVLILLAMPFVLITILGFALGGNASGDITLNAQVAVIDPGNLKAELKQFDEWMQSEGIPDQARVSILEAAEQTSMPELLVDTVMKEELQNLITVTERQDLTATLQNDYYAGVIHFPKSLRFETWKGQFFNQQTTKDLQLYLNEEKGLEASVISDVVENFTDQMRLHTVLTQEAQQSNLAAPEFDAIAEVIGETITVDGKVPVDSFGYFAVGMSTMFALYVVSFVAGYAYYEKATFVYDRILLTNTNPWTYATSKWLSAVLICFLQLCALYGLAAVIYQVIWPDLLAFFTITLFFSFVVGSMAVLITALNYRFETQRISTMFSGFLVSVFAFLGGSFVPWNEVSDTMFTIASFTPNGAALQGYLKILSGGELAGVTDHLFRLAVVSIGLILIAIPIFPKRRLI
ncbi:ABC transporter permease [Sutcliffiella horikoshii]|uniref:ABC transporter permease n=1 Tax=Sutcliffiella horikoshii TaxID=79883 RepID=UPI001F3180EF|nr:ABC transporter permease [Sutcliffiella horikoshii]